MDADKWVQFREKPEKMLKAEHSDAGFEPHHRAGPGGSPGSRGQVESSGEASQDSKSRAKF